MADLVVIVPSRGRPHAAAELAMTFRYTCTAGTELVVAVDENDPDLQVYLDQVRAVGFPAATVGVVDRPRTMVYALNRVALVQACDRDPAPFAIGFMGDDHRPRTVGWDQRYLDALRELGTGLVYGNDMLQGQRIPTQLAMTADIIRELGYMAPPGLTHMYVDNAWLALGQALDRIRYLPNVIVEHQHPVAGKAPWDEGYRRVNDPDVYARDRVVCAAWLRDELPDAAARIRQAADA